MVAERYHTNHFEETVSSEDFGLLLGNFIRTAERLATELAAPAATRATPPEARPSSRDDMLLHLQWRA